MLEIRDLNFEIQTNLVFIFAHFFAVDITLYRNGYHGDLNETFFVGDVDEGARKLVQTTYECLMQAIDAGEPQLLCVDGPLRTRHAHALFVPAGFASPLPELGLGFNSNGLRMIWNPFMRMGQMLAKKRVHLSSVQYWTGQDSSANIQLLLIS